MRNMFTFTARPLREKLRLGEDDSASATLMVGALRKVAATAGSTSNSDVTKICMK